MDRILGRTKDNDSLGACTIDHIYSKILHRIYMSYDYSPSVIKYYYSRFLNPNFTSDTLSAVL